MEAVSERRRIKLTDTPPDVPRILRDMGTLLNDYSSDTQREKLIRFIEPLSELKNCESLKTSIDLLKHYLFYVVTKRWLKGTGVRMPREINYTTLTELLEELEDSVEGFSCILLPTRSELDELRQLVQATVRPSALAIAPLWDDETRLIMTICRTSAEIRFRNNDKLIEAIRATHEELMLEQIDLFGLLIEEHTS